MEKYKNKRILFMGDSITARKEWVNFFNKVMEPSFSLNIAVSSATWKDNSKTVYDGNPLFNGPDNNMNNVIGNQVEKIKRNFGKNPDYNNFDIIIVAAGTNDWGIDEIEDYQKDIENQFFTEDKKLLPLENVNTHTMAGAMRYTYESIRYYYPYADIFYCSPIQACEQRRTYLDITQKREYIKLFCERVSDVHFLDTFLCGICGAYEKDEENGKDLVDGLHPNITGAVKISKYNYREIKKYYL